MVAGNRENAVKAVCRQGLRQAQRVGSSFLYFPNKPAASVLQKAGETLLGYAVAGTVAPLMAHMIQGGKLTRDELQSLRCLLNEFTEEPT